ncbi:MAG: SRPBCC family protein [Rhodospirillaceae bacterium]|nr:SRPBCC family protein [Rhodospirillaceae bacterium]
MATKSKRAARAKPKRAVRAKSQRATKAKPKPRRATAKPKRAAARQPVAVAKAEMMIRRPVADVFIAFVDPLITSNFWFTKGSDRLHMGKTVRWEWEMYGFAVDIDVMRVDENRRILIHWPGEGGPTRVEWTFTARPDNTTFVSITNSGFHGSDAEVVAQAVGTTEGFALVLAGAKAFLEQGLVLDLVADRFPDGLPKG